VERTKTGKIKCPKCGRIFHTWRYRMPSFEASGGESLVAFEVIGGRASCVDCGTEIEFTWELKRMDISAGE
jgi:DNA-directed RNA polymerase subunit RPC12/RpoP